jgi:hypothetical protein
MPMRTKSEEKVDTSLREKALELALRSMSGMGSYGNPIMPTPGQVIERAKVYLEFLEGKS